MKKIFYTSRLLSTFFKVSGYGVIKVTMVCGMFSSYVSGQHDPVQPFKGKIGKTIAETKQSWHETKKAEPGAPNIVWILLDDVGYGAVSTFGGLIQTPTLDSLANNGLRYTNFHT